MTKNPVLWSLHLVDLSKYVRQRMLFWDKVKMYLLEQLLKTKERFFLFHWWKGKGCGWWEVRKVRQKETLKKVILLALLSGNTCSHFYVEYFVKKSSSTTTNFNDNFLWCSGKHCPWSRSIWFCWWTISYLYIHCSWCSYDVENESVKAAMS